MNCVSCDKPFTSNLDKDLCDECVNEAYSHKPELYAHIRLEGGGTYIQPLNQLGVLIGEILEGSAGDEWHVTLIEMTPAEYAKLPEFAGH